VSCHSAGNDPSSKSQPASRGPACCMTPCLVLKVSRESFYKNLAGLRLLQLRLPALSVCESCARKTKRCPCGAVHERTQSLVANIQHSMVPGASAFPL
jgi:hypothetical protein